MLATENRFVLLGPDLTEQAQLPPVFTDPAVRMNDGGCDPQGRFYCGTMAYDSNPRSGDPLPARSPMAASRWPCARSPSPTACSGTPPGDTVFYNDTPTGRVDRFDFDPVSAAFTGRRTFAEIAGAGQPDGMAIDEEDGIWVALWGGSAVHRYDATGRLDLSVELPVSKVTACTFGGPERRTLFITTSRRAWTRRSSPRPGPSSRYAAGVRGAPQHAFAG